MTTGLEMCGAILATATEARDSKIFARLVQPKICIERRKAGTLDTVFVFELIRLEWTYITGIIGMKTLFAFLFACTEEVRESKLQLLFCACKARLQNDSLSANHSF